MNEDQINSNLEALFFRMKQLRIEHRLNEARKYGNKIYLEMQRSANEAESKYASRLWYERGYVEKMAGNFDMAVEMFKNSSNLAKRNDDFPARVISDVACLISRYLSQRSSAKEVLSGLENLHSEMEAHTGFTALMGVRARFVLEKRLSEVAFDASSGDFVKWAEAFRRNPMFFEKSGDKNFAYEIARLQTRARDWMNQRGYKEACKQFSLFVYRPVTMDGEFGLTDCDDMLGEYFHAHAEEKLRDYRDFGLALANINTGLSRNLAVKIWKYALKAYDLSTEPVFAGDIKKMLADI